MSFVDPFVTMRILNLFRVEKKQEDDASFTVSVVLEPCVTNRLCPEFVSQEEHVQAVVSDESEVREVWLGRSLGGGDRRAEGTGLGFCQIRR